MYRLLAIAKYDERYVIPPAHAEQAHSLEELATECSVSEYGGGQLGPLRRGVRRADADRGRELPDAPGPADRRHRGRARRQGVAGEPAQLGRQGQPRAGCSRPGPTTRTDDTVSPHGRRSRRPAALTDAPADARLAVARRCCSATPTSELLGRARPDRGGGRAELPEHVGRTRCGRASHDLEATPLTELRGGLRRDLRQPAPAQPVPHLLRPRRHPQARDGAAAVQADLPARRASSSTDDRAARPPVRRAGVRRHRRPRARVGS